MKTLFTRFPRVSFFFMMMTGLLTGCADHVSPPPAVAYYAYYPGACPTFGPALPSRAQEIAWRQDSQSGAPGNATLDATQVHAMRFHTVPGGANADCLVPDSFFDRPPIYGPAYRTYGPQPYGPVIYRP